MFQTSALAPDGTGIAIAASATAAARVCMEIVSVLTRGVLGAASALASASALRAARALPTPCLVGASIASTF